jgi:hypothetical protein
MTVKKYLSELSVNDKFFFTSNPGRIFQYKGELIMGRPFFTFVYIFQCISSAQKYKTGQDRLVNKSN